MIKKKLSQALTTTIIITRQIGIAFKRLKKRTHVFISDIILIWLYFKFPPHEFCFYIYIKLMS